MTFFEVETLDDLALLLNSSVKQLNYCLYVKRPENMYSIFAIAKKNGGYRKIQKPKPILSFIQKSLSTILYEVYHTRGPAHGFVKKKSIVTNAKQHLNRKWVLNIDLKDFFPTINFGRVQGLFECKPFNRNSLISNIIARLSCYKGKLPQGSPSSPIISNMICARLDRELLELAKRNKCWYTRYADDITFSSNSAEIPAGLVVIDGVKQFVGEKLLNIIESNGFQINESKVHFSTRGHRQEVTGLIVNSSKPQIKRRYYLQVEAMLHSWKKYGEIKAQAEFYEKYDKKQRDKGKPKPLFRNVVKGKIEFIRMVRGNGDKDFLRFALEFDRLVNEQYFVKQKSNYLLNRVIQIHGFRESQSGDDPDEVFGTAFVVDNKFNLITCFHCIEDTKNLYFTNEFGIDYPILVTKTEKDRDIATLNLNIDVSPLVREKSRYPRIEDVVYIAGYPLFGANDLPVFKQARIISVDEKKQTILIDQTINKGMSGGPILNEELKVIGVLQKGDEQGVQNVGILLLF